MTKPFYIKIAHFIVDQAKTKCEVLTHNEGLLEPMKANEKSNRFQSYYVKREDYITNFQKPYRLKN